MLKKILTTAITLYIVVVSIVIVWQRQYVYDRIELYRYQPSSELQEIAQNISLTKKGRDILYLSDPVLHSGDSFRTACTNNEKTIVLGCYDGNTIHVHNIEEPKLEGIVEVTTAHELLHAAYERLSSQEITTINAHLSQALTSVTDQRVLKTIELYKDKDSATFSNELHSILATEVLDLPPELETYYQKYFLNRRQIVEYAKEYEAVFIEYEQSIAEIDQRLLELDETIKAQEQFLSSTKQSITNQKTQLDSWLSQGKISDYNSSITTYNSLIKSYNATLTDYKNNITLYNEQVNKRNELSISHKELIKSIDTSYSEWNVN